MDAPVKVLVIDDEEPIRRSLRSFLQDGGYLVFEAANGRAGLAVFLREQPDVVLTDLRMAEAGGMEFVAAMKTESPDTPLIVVSGTGQMQDAIEVIRRGAWDYLVKPIDNLAVLQHAISRGLERRAMLRQAQQYQQLLEEQVRQRTVELQQANQALEHKTTALREVINTVQAEKQRAAQAVISQIEQTVLPLLQRLRSATPSTCQEPIDHIVTCLRQITSSQADPLARLAASLTPTELRICRLIRQEMSSKDIARAENISRETVETHRRNIRRKLEITNEQVHLATYLQSIAGLEAAT